MSDVVIRVKKLRKISSRYVISSVLFIVIGVLTMTYSETVLLNSFYIGLFQVMAGMFGLLHVVHIVKNGQFVNTFISITILFRSLSYLVEIFNTGYRPGLVNGALIWGIIWIGFTMTAKFITVIQDLQEKTHVYKIDGEMALKLSQKDEDHE